MPDIQRGPAVVVDLAAIAYTSGDDPTSVDDVEHAQPYEPGIHLVRAIGNAGFRLVYITTRDEALREATKRWLHRYIGPEWSTLLMRGAGDSLRPSEVKATLYQRQIAPNYHVVFVIDRLDPLVIDLWKAHGLHCVYVDDANRQDLIGRSFARVLEYS